MFANFVSTQTRVQRIKHEKRNYLPQHYNSFIKKKKKNFDRIRKLSHNPNNGSKNYTQRDFFFTLSTMYKDRKKKVQRKQNCLQIEAAITCINEQLQSKMRWERRYTGFEILQTTVPDAKI